MRTLLTGINSGRLYCATLKHHWIGEEEEEIWEACGVNVKAGER